MLSWLGVPAATELSVLQHSDAGASLQAACYMVMLCSTEVSRTAAAAAVPMMHMLSPPGSDPNSLEFAGRLVQRTLLTIAAAGDALVATFGVAQKALGSLFAVWASREVGMLLLGIVSKHVACTRLCELSGRHASDPYAFPSPCVFTSRLLSHSTPCVVSWLQARGCAGMLRQHVLSAATAASTGLHTTVHVSVRGCSTQPHLSAPSIL